MSVSPTPEATIQETNQTFYDSLWSGARLIDPKRFNTWPLMQQLSEAAPLRLEVGPGLRPRLPIKDTFFADISEPALTALAQCGGRVECASIGDLPYADNTFDLVCALDIVEHVERDEQALDELCRVARPGATLLLSTPLHMSCWTEFDALVGHYRRYEPAQLQMLLADRKLTVTQSGIYGMKPKSSRLVSWGMDHLQKNPERSLWYYNRFFMPLGLLFQKPFVLHEGLLDLDEIGEVFMVCRLDKAA